MQTIDEEAEDFSIGRDFGSVGFDTVEDVS
jgi:hypothetical protein